MCFAAEHCSLCFVLFRAALLLSVDHLQFRAMLASRFFLVALLAFNVSVIHGVKEQGCGTLKIAFYSELTKLTNCTVITGNLVIAVATDPFGEVPEESPEDHIDVNNLTFPLREVTGYFLIFQSTVLESLGRMFPNLTIIRGQRSFSNYALTIYETNLNDVSFR